MKTPHLLLPAAAVLAGLALFYAWNQSTPVAASTGPKIPAAAVTAPSGGGTPSSSPAPVSSNGPDKSHPDNIQAAAGELPAIPGNIKELNQLADGPLPLSSKMEILTKVMMTGPPEQAKAAAVRSVFIVKNADYATHLRPLLVAGDIKREALEVLSLNLYDRPLEIQLPTLAAMRGRAGHPLEPMVADALVFHLKEKGKTTGGTLDQNIRDYLTPPSP